MSDELKAPEISIDALNTMNECVSLFRNNPVRARSWEGVEATINACAHHIPLMRMAVMGCEFGDSVRDSIARKFYNETVGFILGEKRTVNVIGWEGLINDLTGFNDEARWATNMPGSVGSIGSRQLGRYRSWALSPLTSEEMKSHYIRGEMLSYAHRDILKMWMLRPNGLDDMLFSLVMMAKIFHSSDKFVP